ncbi:MAG: hypothetical protein H0V05_05360 [Euzebyaceae bacterium]|jgi:hypothetical protein|nr:hypothetical protein [Euzebyaceae bacterium]
MTVAQNPSQQPAVGGSWVVQLLVERPDGGELLGLDALSTLVNALPTPGATVSWRRDRYLLELPVCGGDVREAMSAALTVSRDARRQAGVLAWPIRSCAVLDAQEYTAARVGDTPGPLSAEPTTTCADGTHTDRPGTSREARPQSKDPSWQ